jgi:hypothetical protein
MTSRPAPNDDALDDLLADIVGPTPTPSTTAFAAWPSADDPPPLLWKTTQAAERLQVDRQVLDALAAKYPDEPGGPLIVGGTTRLHRRWNPATLVDWFTRVTTRNALPVKPVQVERTRPPRPPAPPPAPPPATDFASSRKRLISLGQKKKD